MDAVPYVISTLKTRNQYEITVAHDISLLSFLLQNPLINQTYV
jgi:hypothetical protein